MGSKFFCLRFQLIKFLIQRIRYLFFNHKNANWDHLVKLKIIFIEFASDLKKNKINFNEKKKKKTTKLENNATTIK